VRSGSHWTHELAARASTDVPAYKMFLDESGVTQVQGSAEFFERLPLVTKANYLRAYALRDLLWGGDFARSTVISTSSGSSGSPFYWPRGAVSEVEAADQNERIFGHFATRERDTLCINAFAMGTYIAATYQFTAMTALAERGHRITTVCTGIDLDDNLRVLRDLGEQFEQIVIMGYPPLVRDILEHANRSGVSFPGGRVRLVFAGENFSETWRDHVHELVDSQEPLRTSLSIYGTADAGIIGAETAFTVHVRRVIDADARLREELFPGVSALPSIVAVDPRLRHMEEVDGNIVFTADNALPLIRYAIGDEGRVLTTSAVVDVLRKHGYQLPEDLVVDEADHIVAIYGRADVAATFYSVNIYPENIKDGLEAVHITDRLSGKFVLESVVDDVSMGQTLTLRVELAPGVSATGDLANHVCVAVIDSLVERNQEFRRLHQSLGSTAEPDIQLVPYGSPEFRVVIKHRWAKT
jgi:phenylacetate-CoA ligase